MKRDPVDRPNIEHTKKQNMTLNLSAVARS